MNSDLSISLYSPTIIQTIEARTNFVCKSDHFYIKCMSIAYNFSSSDIILLKLEYLSDIRFT